MRAKIRDEISGTHTKPDTINPDGLNVCLHIEDLAAIIHASLEIDMVRTAALAGLLVFDMHGSAKSVVRTALIALHARNFFPWNSHGSYS